MFQAPKSKHLLNRSRIFGFVELSKRVIDRLYWNLKKWTTINKSGFLGWMMNVCLVFKHHRWKWWNFFLRRSWAKPSEAAFAGLSTSRGWGNSNVVEGPARVKGWTSIIFCYFCNCIMIIYVYIYIRSGIYIYMHICFFIFYQEPWLFCCLFGGLYKQ